MTSPPNRVRVRVKVSQDRGLLRGLGFHLMLKRAHSFLERRALGLTGAQPSIQFGAPGLGLDQVAAQRRKILPRLPKERLIRFGFGFA